MLNHYRELIPQFGRTILAASLTAGLAALAISIVLLRAMPIYESSVTLNMQPSVEDLQFNSAFLGVSQFNPATIIAQTHIERLLSRPVMERAVEIVIEESGGGSLSAPPTAFDAFRKNIFRWLRILNSGYFVEPSEMDSYVGDLRGATSVEIVEGSYILRVTVAHTEPVIAARAANALATAYVELAQDNLKADATEVDRSLAAVISRTEQKRAELVAARNTLARDMGISDVASERANLLTSRSEARGALQSTLIKLDELRAQLDELEAGAVLEGDADVARQLRQSLVTLRSAIAAAEARVGGQRENVAKTEAALRDLDEAEELLDDADRRIGEVDADLADLRDRRVRTDLAREARLSQVSTISAAQVPVYPSSPKVMVNTVAGLIVGGILALVPLLAMDVLGDKIRTSEDLRMVFGHRALPSVTPKLRRQASMFLQQGGRPPQALRRYAAEVGRRFATEGPRRWPRDAVNVTAMGSKDDVETLQTVMQAVIAILNRQQLDGTALGVQPLPPLSQIGDWSTLEGHHVVLGIPAGEAAQSDVDSISDDAGANDRPTVFAALTP